MTIVAAVDGGQNSNRVVQTAAELAEAYEDELTVVHVMEQGEYEQKQDSQPEYYRKDASAEAKDVAREVVDLAVDDADAIQAHGRVGNPTTEIIAEAESLNAKYIVIGGRKRTSVGKAVFGSVTQSVLLNASRPIVTEMAEGE